MEATDSQDLKQEDHLFTQDNIKLGRNLASPDKAKHEKAMSLLCLWLTSQKEINEEELLKIWKGLFYCIWHAERAAAQADLIERMACLMERLDADVSPLFFKVFLSGLRRELESIDKDCLQSFYLLLRQYVSHMFVVLRNNGWNLEVVKKFMDVLLERTFLSQDGIAANGVNLHITDIFLHELNCYLPISMDIFEVLLEPFWMTLVKGCDKELAEQITKKVFFAILDYGCGHLATKQNGHSDEREDVCCSSIAISLLPTIKSKSMALLPFAAESSVVWLKLIQEKSVGLDNLYAHPGIVVDSSNRGNSMANVKSQSYAGNVKSLARSLADSAEKAESSPFHFLITRTFGRRSKNNQKLAFPPRISNNVFLQESPASSNSPVESRSGVESSSAQVLKFTNGGVFVTPLDKNQMNLASAPQQNDNSEQTIGVAGLSAQKDGVMSEETSKGMIVVSEDGITMEDPVISNLTKRFELIVDESTGFEGVLSWKISTPLASSSINTGDRKRKTWRCSPSDSESPTSTKENYTLSQDPFLGDNIASTDNMSAKKAKRVHFSLKHNIVWKPSTPLPPHSVRVPPSATPRGSALKKGLSPGPILEIPVSPKGKKQNPRKAPAAVFRSPKIVKNSAKGLKTTRKASLSPR